MLLTRLIVVIASLFRYRANHYVVYLKLIQCLLVAQLYLTLPDPMDCSPPGSSVHGIPQVRNAGMGCHSLLQGIFLTCELYFNKTGKKSLPVYGKKKNQTGWVQQGGDEFYIYFSNLIKIYNRIHNLRVERIWEITNLPNSGFRYHCDMDSSWGQPCTAQSKALPTPSESGEENMRLYSIRSVFLRSVSSRPAVHCELLTWLILIS